jgi:putative DNA primase/helicase
MTDIERIADATNARPKHGGGFLGHCPAHDDRNPSLSIGLGDNGKPIVKCWSGCSQEAVIDELRTRGLWSTPGQSLSKEELEKSRQRSEQRKAERRKVQDRAAALAGKVWKEADPARPDHPYLERKQARPSNTLKQIDLATLIKMIGYHPEVKDIPLADGQVLIVPVVVDGHISTVEMIDVNGLKPALSKGQKQGGYWSSIRKLPEGDGEGLTLQIGEGVATCLSSEEATGYPTVAALSCGNLLSVARQMRARYPKADITIMADLLKATGEPDPHAIEAAREIGGKLAIPDFGPDRPEGMTDFNDMTVKKGLEAVKSCIEAAVTPGQQEPGPDRQRKIVPVSIGDFLSLEFPPRPQLLSPWLPSQGLTMVFAYRGVGKTHFALGVAYAVSSGGSFLGWQAPAPVGVLYIDGEMPGPVMQERLSAIITSNDKEPAAPFILLTPDLQPQGMPRIDTEEGQEAVEGIITDDIKLIVVDNISTLSGAKENEADGWTPIQEWALRQRSKGRSVLFVHHSGKGGQQRGTSRREDVLDTVIALRRPVDYLPDQGAVFEVHFEKARGIYGDDVKSIEATLFTDDQGRMHWLTQTVEAGNFDRIVQMANDGMKQGEIATELNLHKSNVSRHLKRAKAEGLVKA